jgi:hypothetical protein
MAYKTRWWKDGDHEAVIMFQPRVDRAVLCADCGAPRFIHGKLKGHRVLVHPGDYIVTLDGGEHRVERPDPMAEALAQL